jgi:CheY-like chemotaxis protein
VSVARVLLVHWKPEEAEARLPALRRAGHEVRVMAPQGMPALRALRAEPPDALVIDLGRLPSQGRAVATALRQQKATRAVPLVFVEGEREKTARVKALLPDALYTRWPGLEAALRRALRPGRAGRAASRPVVPDTMAGYSGTPLPKKLGIKPGSVVTLVGAPEGFERTLGPLPESVTLRDGARGLADVVLLFVRSRADLARRFHHAVKAMGDPAALWIVWPKKTSGVESDLGEQAVRDHGLAFGLVDYKIAAIDATWSGLCFARRKAKG